MTCEEDPLTQLGTTAIEGLMKLLLYNRIPGNVEIIKKLLCLSFDPAYQVNTYLIQALTVFFPAYANSDCKLRKLYIHTNTCNKLIFQKDLYFFLFLYNLV